MVMGMLAGAGTDLFAPRQPPLTAGTGGSRAGTNALKAYGESAGRAPSTTARNAPAKPDAPQEGRSLEDKAEAAWKQAEEGFAIGARVELGQKEAEAYAARLQAALDDVSARMNQLFEQLGLAKPGDSGELFAPLGDKDETGAPAKDAAQPKARVSGYQASMTQVALQVENVELSINLGDRTVALNFSQASVQVKKMEMSGASLSLPTKDGGTLNLNLQARSEQAALLSQTSLAVGTSDGSPFDQEAIKAVLDHLDSLGNAGLGSSEPIKAMLSMTVPMPKDGRTGSLPQTPAEPETGGRFDFLTGMNLLV